MAAEVAGSELQARKIDGATPNTEDLLADPLAQDDAAFDSGDLVLVARYPTAAEAYMLQSRLHLESIPAIVTDALMAQNLVPIAIGGVRVLVPEAYLARAREIVLAIENGDFALDGVREEKRP